MLQETEVLIGKRKTNMCWKKRFGHTISNHQWICVTSTLRVRYALLKFPDGSNWFGTLADVDQLVTIKGLMIRASPVIPDMKEGAKMRTYTLSMIYSFSWLHVFIAFFRCLACDHTMTVQVDRGRIMEPTRCPREICSSENTMTLIHNRCSFADKQVCRVQETPGLSQSLCIWYIRLSLTNSFSRCCSWRSDTTNGYIMHVWWACRCG